MLEGSVKQIYTYFEDPRNSKTGFDFNPDFVNRLKSARLDSKPAKEIIRPNKMSKTPSANVTGAPISTSHITLTRKPFNPVSAHKYAMSQDKALSSDKLIDSSKYDLQIQEHIGEDVLPGGSSREEITRQISSSESVKKETTLPEMWTCKNALFPRPSDIQSTFPRHMSCHRLQTETHNQQEQDLKHIELKLKCILAGIKEAVIEESVKEDNLLKKRSTLTNLSLGLPGSIAMISLLTKEIVFYKKKLEVLNSEEEKIIPSLAVLEFNLESSQQDYEKQKQRRQLLKTKQCESKEAELHLSNLSRDLTVIRHRLAELRREQEMSRIVDLSAKDKVLGGELLHNIFPIFAMHIFQQQGRHQIQGTASTSGGCCSSQAPTNNQLEDSWLDSEDVRLIARIESLRAALTADH